MLRMTLVQMFLSRKKLEKHLKYSHLSVSFLEIVSFIVLVRVLKAIHEFKRRGNKRSKAPELLRCAYIS